MRYDAVFLDVDKTLLWVDVDVEGYVKDLAPYATNGPLTVVLDPNGRAIPAATVNDVSDALANQPGVASVDKPVTNEAGEVISSTRVREALQSGDCETATRLLTRPFAIEGMVEHGDKRGRTIGYPTANLSLGNYLRPRFGIYAVRGRLADGRVLEGAANLGIRPTFDPPKELLEPYFFDFSGDLYGQMIEIELISFLRPEERFESLDALVRQMSLDCAEARRRLA